MRSVALLVLAVACTPVPVYPCRLFGAFEAWPATRRCPKPGRVRLRVGEPLRFQGEANDADGWSRVAAALEEAVRKP